MLVEGFSFPVYSSKSVKLKYSSSNPLLRIKSQKDVFVEGNFEITSEFTAPPMLEKKVALSAYSKIFSLKNDLNFSMKLEEWPLATAIAVSNYFRGLDDKRNEQLLQHIEPILESCVSIHFPKISLSHLKSLESAGLLPLDKKNLVPVEAITSLLFKSRESTLESSSQLPEDVSPKR